ncbi:translocation protein [Xaviernesmea oryzae]|uniref:Translocation protein n=1 Tax=Xaviernesmea oryzae TaxID=464029 RepID=A0A1Q9AS77_9HYPH|nr:SDR family NAD(P)-dependent oxidoreductase [Xaviernesmea oryzae]OLP58239.1 translocation protein [Xaviernesmea oryzae]SEL45377.1 Short-chain dehydrogenase [Xaviernesmea oryzae]
MILGSTVSDGRSSAAEHVVITGGSSGIGLAVARIYAARGARVTLIARGQAALDAAAATLRTLSPSASIGVQTADIADNAAVADALAQAEARFGPCSILIACAGVVTPARFDMLSSPDFDRQIAVNLIGTANTIRAGLPGLRKAGGGRLMIVGSGAGLIGLYGYAAYCASKTALIGLAEALRLELAEDGISIGLCFPPDTETPQLDQERHLRPAEAEIMMGKVAPWPAEKVARRIVAAIDRRRATLFFTLELALLGRLGALLRPLLYVWFARQITAYRRRRQ